MYITDPPAPSRNKENIGLLIVEDEGVVAADIRATCEQLGYRVLSLAMTGESAIEKAGALRPSLVLMDITLSGAMNGIEAATRIRRGLGIPVIFVTAHSDGVMFEKAMGADPVGYLLKPFTSQDLRLTIELALFKWEMFQRVTSSESRYRSLFEDNLAAVYTMTLEGVITSANASFAGLVGCAQASELRGRPLRDFSADPGACDAFLYALKERGSLRQVECRLKRADGTTVWVMQNATLLKDGEAQGTMIDITRMKLAADEIRESEERYRQIFDNTSDCISIFDVSAEGRYRFIGVNPASERLVGLTAQSFLGRYMDEFVPAEQAAWMDERFRRCVETGESMTWDPVLEIRGREAHLQTTLIPVKNSAGRVFRIIVVVRDITEGVEDKKALQESEERYRRLVEISPDLVAIQSSDRIAFINPAGVKVLGGRSPEEILGKPAGYFLPRAGTAGAEQWFAGSNGEKTTIQTHVTVRRLDGAEADLEVTAFRVSHDHKPSTLVFARDITERKKWEKNLHLFRMLIDRSNDSIAVLDAVSGRFLDVNQKQCDALGYRREELLTLTAFDVDIDIDQSRRGRFAEIVESPEGRIFESRLRHKDGSIIPVEINTKVVSLDKDYLVAVIRDITERKRALNELKFMNTVLQTQLETSLDGILVVDPERNILSYNSQFVSMWGIPPEAMATRSGESTIRSVLHRIVDPEGYRTRTVEIYRDRNSPSRDEVLLKDGSTFDRYSAPMIASDGTYYGRVWYCRDITSRKRAEEEMLSEKRFSDAVIEGLPGLFCMTDEEGTILRWNRQQETVLGYSQEDLVRMKAWDYVDAELRAPFAQVFADGDGNGPKEQETVLLTKDGKKLPCLMTRLKKNIGGKYYLFSIGTDISELKQIENDLRTSRDQLRMLAGRLESVREEERTLIAREIHDQLGQDLTGIKMNVSLLSKKLCKACAEKENFSYTNELINNAIHSVRKIATDLRPSVLDELGLVAAIEWQAREFERQTGIACTVSIADRHLEVEQGRSTAFFRILQEALTNVARHANASAAQVSFGSLNCAYRLRIEDNGKGISPREVEEPTSLGILGMKERALPFGGTVTISGRDGKGTQVLAHFPMEES